MNKYWLPIICLLLFSFTISDLQAQKKRKDKNKNAPISLLNNADHEKSEYYFIEGEKYFLLGDYAKAYVLFQKASEFDSKNGAAYYKLADILIQTGELDQALIYAQTALKIDPENRYYHLKNAEVYTKQANYSAAAKVYEKMIASLEDTDAYLFDLAALYLYDKDLNKALDVYSKAEEVFGVNPDIVFQKQKIYLKLNDLDKAIAEGEKLITAMPDEEEYVMQLAEILISNNRLDRAEQHLTKLLENNPSNAHARLLLAEVYRQSNREEDANKHLVRAFSSPEIVIDPKLQMMSTFISQLPDDKKEPLAIELSESILEAHPDEANAYAISGDLYFTLNDPEKAIEKYLQALKIDNSNFGIWQNVLDLEMRLNRMDSVVKHADEALELFPNQAALYYFGGTAKLVTKDYQGAVQLLEQGKKFLTGNKQLLSVFHGQLGDAYNNLENFEKSDAAYEEALKIDPSNSHVLNNYAYFLSLRKEKLEKAKKMSTKLVELHPNDPTFLDTHAWVLYTLGDYEGAKGFLEKAIKDTDSGTIIEHYGDVLFRLGDIEGAVTQWQRAKGMDDTSEMIDKKIADKKLYEE